MNLYLHIGTEKTGSSFLQTYLAKNRKTLEKHKICFPHGGVQENNMQKGIITPGNATDLEKNMKAERWDTIKYWLLEKIEEAQKKHCDTILLSNEILMLQLAEEGRLSKLMQILEDLCISLKGILLIVREPVSQAMSLYKHRTKNGKFIPIEKWLDTNYFIADALSGFYKVLSKTDISLSQYEYKKDSEYLVDVCINQWLELNHKIRLKPQNINPSLTLSELVLLSEISKIDKILAKQYYQFMLGIDNKYKSDDIYYKSYVIAHINNYMVGYNDVWKLVNSKMNATKTSYHYKKCSVPLENKITSFSATQIEIIAGFINYSKSLSYRKHKAIQQLNKKIRLITPKFFKKNLKRIFIRH